MALKKILILGSTGSIGINTLKVVDRYPDRFKVVGLSAYNNKELLKEQVAKYRPKHILVGPQKPDDLAKIVSAKDVDVVVIAIRGAAALVPFLAAAKAGKIIAPANKEALVIAGELIMTQARKNGAMIIPVDSEQSAIFQCLDGQKMPVERVHLTASGGPLRDVPVKEFKRMTVKDILRHPRWKMGPKITVDSATLMNKGFEFIEAQRLFGLRHDQIEVVIHPEAIIHSMVEFADGSVLAQLGITDMRLPIQYALTYPKRLPTGLARLDFAALKQLNFSRPDTGKFPALALALEAAKQAGSMPCVLNAANEEAVEEFLNGRLVFTSIYKVVEKVIRRHKIIHQPSLDQIFATDQWAREQARGVMENI
jgi:1-deoxy-D-xylulose-5-phosphate reductoisomerase